MSQAGPVAMRPSNATLGRSDISVQSRCMTELSNSCRLAIWRPGAV